VRIGRVVVLPLLWLIRGYQTLVSPLRPPTCRYYPSCSAYAVTALERFGPLRGTWLAARRLGRCHPWTPGGVDHVPWRDPSTGRPVPGTTGPRGLADEHDGSAHRHPHPA
jgi:uncharacterized protein